MRKTAIPIMLTLLAGFAAAQTTGTIRNPFVCDASGAYPATNFEVVVCRGVFFYDSTDKQVAELFFWGFGRFQGSIVVNGATVSMSPYTSIISNGQYTAPVYGPPLPYPQRGYSTTTPGTFSFDWSGPGSDGMPHSGSMQGTWTSQEYCGGERCWYHPVLLTSTVTINN